MNIILSLTQGGKPDIYIIIAPKECGSSSLAVFIEYLSRFVCVCLENELRNAEPFSKMRLNYLKFLGKYRKVDMGNKRGKEEGELRRM